MVGRLRKWIWFLTLATTLGLSTGCQSPDLNQKIQDPDPVVRIQAMIKAAEIGAMDTVPLLVDRLDEENDAVRFFAIASLRRLTGKDYGYDYKADRQSRAQAIARWRQALTGHEPEQPSATNQSVRE